MNRLEGKIALITGGAGAIGSATAAMMLREGAHVFVTDIEDDADEASYINGHDLAVNGGSLISA